MEIDDLKESWRNSTGKIKTPERDIIALIQNKGNGPAAQLKRRFRKGLLLIPFVACIVTIQFSKKGNLFSDVLYWYFIGFCVGVMAYFYFNYRLVSRMQTMENNVKENLLQQVQTLQAGLKWRLIITRGLVVIFILLLELLLYLRQEPRFSGWYGRPVHIRLLAYAGAVIFFYFLTKFALHHRYGKHIRYLQTLTEQMK